MMARKFGRIVNITSAAVKAPIEVLGLFNGARAGLTGFVAGLARQSHDNVTINGLLPGPFDTDRMRGPSLAMPRRREKRGSGAGRTSKDQSRGADRRPRGIGGPARSSAAPRPDSSPARTSCSTAAHFRARCEDGLVRANGTRARVTDLWRDADADGRPGRGPGAAGGVRRQSSRRRPPRRRLSRDGVSTGVIPNSDGAGIVDQVGDGVTRLHIGQRVWLFNGQRNGRAFGTAAEYISLAEHLVTPLPDKLSFAEGATLGIPAMTAWTCLFCDGPIVGKRVLVTGGAGAVGHYAVQLAKWGGAHVIATVSSAAKAEQARLAGVDFVVNYRSKRMSSPRPWHSPNSAASTTSSMSISAATSRPR